MQPWVTFCGSNRRGLKLRLLSQITNDEKYDESAMNLFEK